MEYKEAKQRLQAKGVIEKIYPAPNEDELSPSLNELKPLSLKQLMDYESPEEDYLIQNLMNCKSIVVLAGASATYKSWLCISLGFAVSQGNPFLGNFPTKQGNVLFIDRENSIPELKKRCALIMKGLKLEKDDSPFYFLSEQSIKLDNPNSLHSLKSFLLTNKIKLVICDTYRRLISFEENDATSVSAFFTDSIKPLCEETGVSFLFIHHHKKGKSEGDEKELLRGSSDFVNFIDGVLQVSRKGQKLIIRQTKNRNGREIEPFLLLVETDEDSYFRFSYDGFPEDLSKMNRGVEILMKWFAKSKVTSFKTKDAQDQVVSAGIKKVNFYTALNELIKIGQISRTGKGTYEVMSQKEDLGIVHCSTTKSVEQLNNHMPNKSSSSNSSIEQSELLNNQLSHSSVPPKIVGEYQL